MNGALVTLFMLAVYLIGIGTGYTYGRYKGFKK